MPDGVMSLPGDGERIVGRGIDATIKVTTSEPAFSASSRPV